MHSKTSSSSIHLWQLGLFLLLQLRGMAAQARLAKPDDLASVNEYEHAEIFVDAQGHNRSIIDRLIRINNDEGRERESVQVIDFNDRASKFKLLQAETINEGPKGPIKSPVAKQNIEIKAVGDFSRSFDVQKKAKVSFPNVQIGSRIHIKYEIDVREVPNEGFWSLLADFNGWYMENYEATVHSVLPLYTWKNDPHDNFTMEASQAGKLHVLKIRTHGPIQLAVTQEENAFIRSERSATFVITTLNNWRDYAARTIERQAKLLRDPLPPTMRKIQDEAMAEPELVAKLDKVAAQLSSQFRYFGDWRRRDGGFLPRSLNEIEQTRYGDCKDLSLAATAIYRAMGLKADMVWTLRGEHYLKPSKDWYRLPVDWFNHAITRVEAGGKVFWIDPTNPVSYAQFVPQDVSGKPAFVLRPGAPFLEFIPELRADTYAAERKYTYALQPDQSLRAMGELLLRGRAAINLTISAFYKPIATLNYELVHALSYGSKVLDSHVGEYPHASRIVADFKIPFEFVLGDSGVRTTAGYGVMLERESAIDRLLEEVKDRASDLHTGDSPGVWSSLLEINGVKKVGSVDLSCHIESPWVKASRVLAQSDTGVRVEDRLEILESVIDNKDLHAPAFARFQDQLRSCFFREAIILH